MRKWFFILAGTILLGAVVVIFSKDSALATPVQFSRYETNISGEVSAVFSVPGHPIRRYATCARIEQMGPIGEVVAEMSGNVLDLKRGEVTLPLPEARLCTRVVFLVFERKFSDRLKQLTHGIDPPSREERNIGRHFLVTNTLPGY